MSKVVICVIARMASTRLPGKVLAEVGEKPILEQIIGNLSRSRINDIDLVVCTTELAEDDPLESAAVENNVGIVRGPVLSVADRMFLAAELFDATTLVRVTGDNLFTDVVLHDFLVTNHISGGFDYSRFTGLANGVTAEVVQVAALQRCYSVHDRNHSEYMTLHLNQPDKFSVLSVLPERSLRSDDHDLSVDTPADLEKARSIFQCADPNNLESILQFLKKDPSRFPEIDPNSLVKLPNEKVRFDDYKRRLLELSENSSQIQMQDGWYAKSQRNYFD